MPVGIEVHTVPHFKAQIYAKLELLGLEYGGKLSFQTSLLNTGRLLHKMGFVQREIATTVICTIGNFSGEKNHYLCLWLGGKDIICSR